MTHRWTAIKEIRHLRAALERLVTAADDLLAVLEMADQRWPTARPMERLDATLKQARAALAEPPTDTPEAVREYIHRGSEAGLDVETIRSLVNGHESDCTYFDGGVFSCSCGNEQAVLRGEAWLDARDQADEAEK